MATIGNYGTFHSRRNTWCITSVSTLVGRGQFKPAQTSLVQFSTHDKEQHPMGLALLLILTLIREAVKFRLSGLKLSVNAAIPCSKLLYTEVREVFQESMKWTLVFRT